MAQGRSGTSAPQRGLVPMKATAGPLPEGGGWAFEIKWDGMRAVAEIVGDAVTLWSSNGIDMTVRFPELADLGHGLGVSDAVLDGEIVVFDGERPNFGRLQSRMHVGDATEAARLATETPVMYQVFDLLRLDGRDLLDVAYRDRRRLLEALVAPGPFWVVPPNHLGDGHDLLDAVEAQGLEGLVAKRLDSTYVPGKRAGDWQKVKVRREQELVVGGWVDGTGSRSGRLGALLVGYHEDGALRYAGRVGTGFSEAELRRLGDELTTRADDRCPFEPPPPTDVTRRAHWVEPSLVVQIAFGEWTSDGRLRHPSYLGQRVDKDATDVRREN